MYNTLFNKYIWQKPLLLEKENLFIVKNKHMDKVRQRIDEIYKEKENLQNEFEELQNNCPHDFYKIGLFSWRVGNISTSRFCVHCDKCLGHASDIEDVKFAVEQVNGMGKTIYPNIKEK